MDNNFTVIASLCTAFAAIVAPLITSILSSIKEYKIKTLDLKYSHKMEAMKKFIETYADLETLEKITYYQAFEKSTLNLVTLCRKRKTRKTLISLFNLVTAEELRNHNTDVLYSKCIKLLHKEL